VRIRRPRPALAAARFSARVAARAGAAIIVLVIAVLTLLVGALPASASSWTAATPGVFGVGDSIFMQCGDTLGVGSRSLGMVAWSGATTEDLRARLSSSVSVWPWMTQPSHQAELDAFQGAGTLVIGLGTNDSWQVTPARYRANVEWFLSQAAGRPVVWFNIYRPQFARQVAVLNSILADEAQQHSNLHIIDWAGYVVAHPEMSLSDHIHLDSYADCRTSRLALIHAAVPPVAGQDQQPDWSDPAPDAPPSPNPITAAAGRSLGWATSGPECGHRYSGCVQTFAHGVVAWSPRTGAHVVPAAVAAAWMPKAEVGGAGYPTGDASCTLPQGGCSQQYERGTYFWSPTTSASLVIDPLLAAYTAAGGPGGVLGEPVTAGATEGGREDFQHGSIYWSPAGGAHPVTGAIRSSWLGLGGINSLLGYPTSDVSCSSGTCAQTFQSGSISWTAAQGSRIMIRRSPPGTTYRAQ
jgi:hypothetical protein